MEFWVFIAVIAGFMVINTLFGRGGVFVSYNSWDCDDGGCDGGDGGD